MEHLIDMYKNTLKFVFMLLEHEVGDLNHGKPVKGFNRECKSVRFTLTGINFMQKGLGEEGEG